MLYFTINEANDVLPEVIKKFEMTLAKKNEVAKLEQQLQMVINSSNKFDEYIPLKQKLNTAITQFYESSENLEKTGVARCCPCLDFCCPSFSFCAGWQSTLPT